MRAKDNLNYVIVHYITHDDNENYFVLDTTDFEELKKTYLEM